MSIEQDRRTVEAWQAIVNDVEYGIHGVVSVTLKAT
jgi:hypothetical protein